MASTYEPIATTTLNSSQASVTFGSGGTLSQAYTDLIIIYNAQVNSAAGTHMTFNGDTGTNYSNTFIYTYLGTPYSSRNSNAYNISNNWVYGESTTANVFTTSIIQINNYSNQSTYKIALWKFGSTNSVGGNGEVDLICGLWKNTNAITSITLTAANTRNYVSGSTFTLYGIKAA